MQLGLPSVKYEKSYLLALEEGKKETGIAVLRKPSPKKRYWILGS